MPIRSTPTTQAPVKRASVDSRSLAGLMDTKPASLSKMRSGVAEGNRAGSRCDGGADGYRNRQDAPTQQPVLRGPSICTRLGPLTKSGGHRRGNGSPEISRQLWGIGGRVTLSLRDFLQATPERIFESDAGFVSINPDGAFDDLRFHGAPLRVKAVLVRSYRDSVPPRGTQS